MVSSTWTAVAGSLTSGDRAAARRRPAAGRRTSDPGRRSVPARSAARRVRLSSVTSPPCSSATGAPCRSVSPMPAWSTITALPAALEQPGQVDLLQGGLPVRPPRRRGAAAAALWRRAPRGAGPAVEVVQDAAAFRRDRRERWRQLDGREGPHLQDPHQGDRERARRRLPWPGTITDTLLARWR